MDRFFEDLPAEISDIEFVNAYAVLQTIYSKFPSSALVEIPMTKRSSKVQRTFLSRVRSDIAYRHGLSNDHRLHVNYYELDYHGIEHGWPDLAKLS